MIQKTISLSEDAYNCLKRAKKEGESFSHLILRIIRVPKTQELMNFAGVFKDDSKTWDKIEKTIYQQRSANPELDEEILEE